MDPATNTTANNIGRIHEVAVFNSSLLLPARACGMVAQWQGGSSLSKSLLLLTLKSLQLKHCGFSI